MDNGNPQILPAFAIAKPLVSGPMARVSAYHDFRISCRGYGSLLWYAKKDLNIIPLPISGVECNCLFFVVLEVDVPMVEFTYLTLVCLPHDKTIECLRQVVVVDLYT